MDKGLIINFDLLKRACEEYYLQCDELICKILRPNIRNIYDKEFDLGAEVLERAIMMQDYLNTSVK